MKKILTTIVCALMMVHCLGQTITVPNFNDKYCDYVRTLESGQTDIDYQDFRFSLIESEQFKLLSKKSTEFNGMKKEMYLQMKKSNYEEIIRITQQMLSIDYTSMLAHKILRQTYEII